MRLKTRISASLSSSTAEEQDIANIMPTSYEISDVAEEGSNRVFKVTNGTVSQTVDLSGLGVVNFIYLRSNKEVTLHITADDGPQDIPIHVPDGNDYGYFCANLTGITSVNLSNSSGSTASVYMIIAGDEA